MSFTAPKFTGVGRQLQTRVIAGDTLTFTAIKLGDGTMTTEPIAALTDLIHGIITLPVHEVRRNADYADVTGVFQNAGLSSGFYWREIGIFAADPDYPNDRSHDILYCYQNAAELAEYIPSASSAVIEKIIRVACVVGDAENVTVGLASQAYAKAEDLQALEEQHSKDVERINNALDAVDPTKITTKAAPADGDGVMIADSADGGKAKRLLWSNVKAALGKLFVPLARKINGKALSADVTLTGDDIAMGADDAETLRAATAKQKMVTFIIKDGGHRILFADGAGNVAAWCDGDTAANATLQATIGKVTLSLHCVITPTGDYGLALNRTMDGVNWNKLADVALCVAPEVHDFPLASGVRNSQYSISQYSKTQESVVTLNVWAVALLNVGTLIGTLPEGYRPRTNHACSIFVVTTKFGVYNSAEIVVQTNGNVYCYGSALDGSEFELGFSISFIAAS